MKASKLLLISFLMGGLAMEVLAEPANSAARRTLIATGDADASVAFYRDLLGFEVTFDFVIDNPAGLALLAPGTQSARAVTLQHPSQEAGYGSVGLYEYDFIEPPTACAETPQVGAVGLLLLTNDMRGMYDKLTGAGYKPVAPPMEFEERLGRGEVNAFSVYDPNCVRVVFSQLVEEDFEESVERYK